MTYIDPNQEEQIDLAPSTPVDRQAAPDWVCQRYLWSRFHRLLGKAPARIQWRIDAWGSLVDPFNWSPRPLVVPALVGAGIFRASIRRVDQLGLQDDDTLTLNGFGLNTHGDVGDKTMCSPHGPLTISKRIPDFACDITGIEGISESKSADRHFGSVQAFGADFQRHKQTPIDAQGLAMALAHPEVRIRNAGTSDSFRVHTWDGRVFLCNSGGSHHFSMAVYIAAQLNQAVPLRGPLEVVEVNEKTVEWLLSNFLLFAVPKQFNRPYPVAMLAGSGYLLDGLKHIGMADARLLLIERASVDSNEMQLLLQLLGATDMAVWFRELLRVQDANKTLLYDKFNGLERFG